MAASGLRSIIYSEFDVIIGPRLAFHAPEGSFREAWFVLFKDTLIPKPALCNKVTVVRLPSLDLKVVGIAINVVGEQYARNALLYNLAFVFGADEPIEPYRQLVQKFAMFLRTLEVDSRFLSTPATKAQLPALLKDVYTALRTEGECRRAVTPSDTLVLIVTQPRAAPPHVAPWHVPVWIRPIDAATIADWSLDLRHVVPFINGINHVRRIALFAAADVELVQQCVQNLIYYDYVALVDIFQFSNVYQCTERVQILANQPELMARLGDYALAAADTSPPSPASVVALYSMMQPPLTVKDLCSTREFSASGLNAHRFVVFGVLFGIIRRLHRMALRVTDSISADERTLLDSMLSESAQAVLAGMVDGRHCYDEMCCALELSARDLDRLLAGRHVFWLE